ncbi:MAG: neutral/alkaline non-lysosomal ceramidase N-terminal domain-containing protein [Armatimonadota bacterium]
MAGQLRAGLARIDVTPPIGTIMAGYAARDHGAEGIHDPLLAKALALSDGDTTLLLITCDIISFNYRFTDPLRARIDERTGIPAANILVSNSHTHSGPLTWGVLDEERVDPAYMDVLAAKLVSIAQMAADQMRPATVGFARRQVRVGYNRRAMTPDQVEAGEPMRGPLAPFVDVMAVRDEGGGLLAAWFCHAAHAVVLGPDNYLFSADYPGPAQATVEAVHPGCTAMFAQGCCGDINAVRSRPGTFEEVRSRGQMLGGAVIAAAEEARALSEVALAAAGASLELPLQDPPPVEQLEAELAELRPAREAAEAAGDIIQEQVARWRSARREEMLELARAGAKDLTRRFDVTALRIGPAAIVGLPGEVLVEYATWIERDSPFSPTIVPAYTNGMVGYVATASAIARGGYEVDSSFDYYGGLPLRPQVEPVLLAGVAQVLAALA